MEKKTRLGKDTLGIVIYRKIENSQDFSATNPGVIRLSVSARRRIGWNTLDYIVGLVAVNLQKFRCRLQSASKMENRSMGNMLK